MGTSTVKTLENELGKEFSEKDRFFGFVNKNNICYANSITQCLFNSSKFKKNILNVNEKLVIYQTKI